MNRLTRLSIAAATVLSIGAIASQVQAQARETYHGGPLGYSSGTVSDARTEEMLDGMAASLTHVTGSRAEVREVGAFVRPGAGTTFCGTVRYNGGPWVSFIMRSAPDLLVQPQIRSTEPREIADWKAVGCDRDDYIFIVRPDAPPPPPV